MCKNFYFSILIPGQLILKEYNWVILPKNKSDHLLFLVWVLLFCHLFIWKTQVIPQAFQSSHSIYFQKDWNSQCCICFLFCFIKFLNMLKISTDLQQYRKLLHKKKYSIIIFEISILEMLVKKMYSFILISMPKLVQKESGENPIITHREYTHTSESN